MDIYLSKGSYNLLQFLASFFLAFYGVSFCYRFYELLSARLAVLSKRFIFIRGLGTHVYDYRDSVHIGAVIRSRQASAILPLRYLFIPFQVNEIYEDGASNAYICSLYSAVDALAVLVTGFDAKKLLSVSGKLQKAANSSNEDLAFTLRQLSCPFVSSPVIIKPGRSDIRVDKPSTSFSAVVLLLVPLQTLSLRMDAHDASTANPIQVSNHDSVFNSNRQEGASTNEKSEEIERQATLDCMAIPVKDIPLASQATTSSMVSISATASSTTVARPPSMGPSKESFLFVDGLVYTPKGIFGIDHSDGSRDSQNEPQRTENRGVDGQNECTVCLSDTADVLLMPCRHLCVCRTCQVHLDKCPVCRSNYVEHIHVERDREETILVPIKSSSTRFSL